MKIAPVHVTCPNPKCHAAVESGAKCPDCGTAIVWPVPEAAKPAAVKPEPPKAVQAKKK